MNSHQTDWEKNIIDNADSYSIVEWRPLDKSTKTIVKTYDTSLGYTGAVTYTCNGESPVNGTYWCYFDQIEDNLTEKEKSDVDVQINLDNEWWK